MNETSTSQHLSNPARRNHRNVAVTETWVLVHRSRQGLLIIRHPWRGREGGRLLTFTKNERCKWRGLLGCSYTRTCLVISALANWAYFSWASDGCKAKWAGLIIVKSELELDPCTRGTKMKLYLPANFNSNGKNATKWNYVIFKQILSYA